MTRLCTITVSDVSTTHDALFARDLRNVFWKRRRLPCSRHLPFNLSKPCAIRRRRRQTTVKTPTLRITDGAKHSPSVGSHGRSIGDRVIFSSRNMRTHTHTHTNMPCRQNEIAKIRSKQQRLRVENDLCDLNRKIHVYDVLCANPVTRKKGRETTIIPVSLSRL